MLHFLVAVDGSAHSLSAVRWVAHLRGASHLRCTLLNVQKPLMPGEVGVIAPASLTLEERERSATEVLERAAGLMRAAAVAFETERQMDDAATAIVERADALECDAIVTGRRGLGAVRRALMGSVSSEVIRRSRLPVIVVNAAENAAHSAPLRLLLAVDGSGSAMRAAIFAARLAQSCGSEVQLAHVQPGRTVASAILGLREKLIEHWSGKSAEDSLSGARAALRERRVACTEHVVAGDDVAGAVLDTARQNACNMIVMGTRGLGPVTGLLMGSVAQGVTEHLPPEVAAVALIH